MDKTQQKNIAKILKSIKNPKLVKLYKAYPLLINELVIAKYNLYGELPLTPSTDSELHYEKNLKCKDCNVYTGQVDSRNRRHGLGIVIFSDSSLYIGFSKLSTCKGHGRLFSYTGRVYEGRWKGNFLRNTGKIYYEDNKTYEGGISNNIPHGKGVLELPTFWKYVGNFLEGLKHGEGCYSFDNHQSSYSGFYFKGKMEGRGKLELADGTMYDGEFLKSKYHGKGKLRYKKEFYYEGDFVEGVREGFGVNENYVTGCKYEGYWRQDKPDGNGKEKRADGLLIEGLWKAGIMIECYNDALDDPIDVYPAYNKKTLAADLNEVLDKVWAARAGLHDKYIHTLDDSDLEEETIAPIIIQPFNQQLSPSEILQDLYQLSEIVVAHSLYTLSLKKYKSLEKFIFEDPDFNQLKVKYLSEWVLLNKEGAVFKGERDKREIIHGRGVVLHGGKIFQGFFEKSVRSGLGREIYPNGSYYEGYWTEGRKNGWGVEVLDNGTCYSGDWVNDRKEGMGIMVSKEWRYEGQWAKDVPEGFGKVMYSDDSKYEGEFLSGSPNGYGSKIEADGTARAGLWRNGKLVTGKDEINEDEFAIESEVSRNDTIPNEISYRRDTGKNEIGMGVGVDSRRNSNRGEKKHAGGNPDFRRGSEKKKGKNEKKEMKTKGEIASDSESNQSKMSVKIPGEKD